MRLKHVVSGAVAAALALYLIFALCRPRPSCASTSPAASRADADRDPAVRRRAGEAGQVGADIASVIAADLERSGLFRPLDAARFIQNVADRRRRRASATGA